jgi:hypothetical protein
MTVYMAVVKYPVDASLNDKSNALLEGLSMIAMELVAEHDFEVGDLENAFADAQFEGELELDMKCQREES